MSRNDSIGASAASPAAPKISLSLGSSRKAALPPSHKPKRPHALLDEDEREEESAGLEIISEFGTSSATNGAKKELERVIQSLPNRDWQEDMRRKRQKSSLPSRDQTTANIGNAPEVVEASKQYGLTFRERSTSPEHPNNDAVAEAAVPQPVQPRTADEEALDALMGNAPTQQTIIRAQSPQNEEDAFRLQYAEAPNVATLEEYTATPVEGFGAAILRGYLAPGETLESRMAKGKSNDRKIERRPGLLGIGAKNTGEGVELGAWAPKRGGKKGKDEISYNPLARKNMKTGELLTEDELKRKLEQQQLVGSDRGSGKEKYDDRDRDRDRYDDRKSSRRERHYDDEKGHRRYRDEDRNGHSSSRRHRSISADRKDRKRRDDDYDRHDRKDKDRSRRHGDDRYHGHSRSSHRESRH